jgi:hypothetical protein
VQHSLIASAPYSLQHLAHGGFFVNDKFVMGAIADPSQFSLCLNPLSNDSQHGD